MPAETSNAPLKILHIEDDLLDARMLRDQVALVAPGHFDFIHCERLDAAIERLAAGEAFAAALLDLSLPDSVGLETFAQLRAQAPGLPILIMTGLDDQSVAAQAVRGGAQDFLVKGQITGRSVRSAIDYAIERVRLLSDLEASRREQAELKDQFLSHVSHELRMPLTVIYQAIANLLSGVAGALTPEQRECLEIAEPNVKQLRKMIDNLLEVARSDAAAWRIEPQPLDLRALLVRVVRGFQPVAQARGIGLSGDDLPAALPTVRADPDRIEEVLMNLIDNALKYTPAGGSIRVGAALRGEPAMVRVEVRDTGCGLSDAARDRIFGRMHQEPQPIESSRKGLGIGLFLCRQIIERHGGAIWVESELGRGSTFIFTLPADGATAANLAAGRTP